MIGHPAAHDDTAVLTPDGFVPLRSLTGGSRILAMSGGWAPVRHAHPVDVDGSPGVRVEAIGVPGLVVHEGQPLLVHPRGPSGPVCDPVWVDARDAVGYLPLPLPRVAPSGLSAEGCWLLGRVLASGGGVARDRDAVEVRAASRADAAAVRDAGQRLGCAVSAAGRTVRVSGAVLRPLLEPVDWDRADVTLTGRELALPQPLAGALMAGFRSGAGSVTRRGPATRLSLAVVAARAQVGPFAGRHTSLLSDGSSSVAVVWLPVVGVEPVGPVDGLRRVQVDGEQAGVALGGVLLGAQPTCPAVTPVDEQAAAAW